jgi:membrane protease subunit HflK
MAQIGRRARGVSCNERRTDHAMTWNEGGPWGSQDPPSRKPPNGSGGRPPRGPWGPTPPELDALLARVRAQFRRFPGGGSGTGGRGVLALVLIAAAIWLATGFYRVQPDEQGVVLQFGAYVRPAFPGLNYHLPWPIEDVERPAVTRINRTEIGYRTPVPGGARADRESVQRGVAEESLMLTGDENIIDIDFAVFWRIRNAADYLFKVRNPDATVKSAAESAMREVIGRTPIGPALTGARAQIETSVLRDAQAILDQYGTGVEITQVQLQKVDPPAAVIDSFRDVQRANTDADRARNEAESYRNDIVPRARGDAARIVAEADGSRQAAIAEATGGAQRFDSVLAAYQAAKDITMRRLYIETMQNILTHTPTTIVDDRLKSILPLLPLNEAPHSVPAPQSAPQPLEAPKPPAQ